MSTPTLQQRYGLPSARRRRLTVAAVALLAAMGVAWLMWAALAQSDRQAISGTVTDARIIDDRHAVLEVTISAPAGSTVTCAGVAYDGSAQVVGTNAVTTSLGDATSTRVSIAIGSVTRPTSVDLVRCVRAAAP